mmetsp:Transcript_31970/g.33204  ORF Transcript_31970/g.33204 Transcript_31970/m.33204 type:complete len:333 (-) Transcript_31970:48-1046(-)
MREVILRTIEKDNQYSDTISKHLVELFHKLNEAELIPSSVQIKSETLESFSSLLYYVLCYYGTKKVTVGEEYVFSSKAKIGCLFIMSKVFKSQILRFSVNNAKFLLQKLVSYFTKNKSSGSNNNEKTQKSSFLNTFIACLFNADQELYIQGVKEIEICLLFIISKYYDIADLLFGSYFKCSRDAKPLLTDSAYKVLGFTLLYSILYRFWVYSKKKYQEAKRICASEERDSSINELSIEKDMITKLNAKKNDHQSITEKEGSTDTKDKEGKQSSKPMFSELECLLCLEVVNSPTTTFCGHVFCWKCITDYLQENPKCPKCRTQNFVNNLLLIK